MKNVRGTLLFLSFFVAVAACAFAWSPEVVTEFQKANVAYREGSFDEAAAAYEKLSQEHPDTAVFFYDLGGALHRKGELGPAILAYERARQAEPRNQDVLYNLNYVRGLLEYRVEDKRLWYIRVAETVLGYFTFKEVMTCAFASFSFFAGMWAFSLFFRRDELWGWRRKSLVWFFLFFAALAVIKNIQVRFFRDAIVMAKEAQVRYGPSVNDQTAFRVGEGLKVYVVDTRENWSRVLLPNNESGWVKNEEIAEVRL